jgi:arylsulfatase A-like enzyme
MCLNELQTWRLPLFVLALVLMLAGCRDEIPSKPDTATPDASEPPNIVFILTDDMTVRDLRYMPKTNKLLGAEGTTFENAFVTYSICCPSRSTFLRGQYAHNHGIVGNWEPFGGAKKFRRLGLDESTVATWLDSAGYDTFLAGKYLNDYEGTYVPPGWDEWYARTSSGFSVNEYNENGKLVREDDYIDADLIGYWSMRYLQEPRENPFFMYLSTHAPHSPHEVAPRHEKSYPNARAPRPPSFNERDLSDKPAWIQQRARDPFSARRILKLDEEYRERIRALQSVDEMVEDVYTTLKSTGELSNTYIFFTSDNGYKTGEHRLFGKWTAYEEDIRVPLLVRGPGVPSGRNLQHMVLNNDFAPTFAEIGKAKPGHPVDGHSFAPLLGTEAPSESSWRQQFLVENYRSETPQGTPSKVPGYKAVRTKNYVYIEHRTNPVERELYDLEEDPHQLESLHETADRALLRKLDRQLSRLARCKGAECRRAEDGG